MTFVFLYVLTFVYIFDIIESIKEWGDYVKYIPYVNIKMGTKSHRRRSYGNTLPLVQRPFGMCAFSVQTESTDGWYFQPDHEFIEGIRLTHQPSPWINDHGTFLMTVQNDIIGNNGDSAWSGYRIQDAVFRPDYLKVKFLRSNASFDLAPTERCAAIRISLGDERQSYLSFLPVKGEYSYSFDKESCILYGTTNGKSGDKSVNFNMYYTVIFDKDAVDTEKCYTVGEGRNAAIHIALKKRETEIRLGTSYISHELAALSIERECTGKSFEDIRKEAELDWEEKLSRIEIETDDEEQMKTFYSCLYRTFLYPHKAYELDKDGSPVHYTPHDGSVRAGVRYTDNGFWDTYRTVYPLYTLIAKEEFAEILEGYVVDYLECGWLPRWTAMGEVGCMPSTLIDAVIAEAAVNGIGDRSVLENAFKGMLHHANNESEDPRYGRNGALSYLKYGYMPRDEVHESVNLTQDSAYGDFCIAKVAEVLGHYEYIDEYMERSKNYKNIFDPVSGFMRGKDKEGKMAEFFDPTSWGGEYTEGSAWQNSFAVPHDIEGLASLHGSKEKLSAKLDELFTMQPYYRVFGYRGEIHEMTEMALVDFGQMAISNQPSFHLPYIYAVIGEQEKTDYYVEKLAREAFHSGDDGYPGDEDNGTTSAWYIFATIGMYRLCPGKTEWIRSKKLVKNVKILGKDLI